MNKSYPVRRDQPFPRKGRGASSNASGRFEVLKKMDIDDGWESEGETTESVVTRYYKDSARSVITRNNSPDIYFDRSINPYRGCEHGCIYCFARPTHTYLGHSAGLDFERLLYAKLDADTLLKQELAKPGYQARPIGLGVNTDAYQPLERKLGITRKILQVLVETAHPVFMITKSSLIERDIDLLKSLSERNLVTVSVSLTTLDHELARRLEPRATAPSRRLRTIERLSAAGIPTRVSVSPIIPALNESEIESILQAAATAGAVAASYIILRLPHELSTLFPEWLTEHYPMRANRVLKAIDSLRRNPAEQQQEKSHESAGDSFGEGSNYTLNDAEFGTRMRGFGPRADIIRQRFEVGCKRAGLAIDGRKIPLDVTAFRPPSLSPQLTLFE